MYWWVDCSSQHLLFLFLVFIIQTTTMFDWKYQKSVRILIILQLTSVLQFDEALEWQTGDGRRQPGRPQGLRDKSKRVRSKVGSRGAPRAHHTWHLFPQTSLMHCNRMKLSRRLRVSWGAVSSVSVEGISWRMCWKKGIEHGALPVHYKYFKCLGCWEGYT